jgi:prephenate dehydrogenase
VFDQITIIGTGLIGGSLALALKRRGFSGRIVGCDRPDILASAGAMGAIDVAEQDAERSVKGSDLVVLASPVGAIIDLIERVGPVMSCEALLTDTGSTKFEIAARAQQVFGEAVTRRFLPGHPMAGKESAGVENADADLFVGRTWAITPNGGTSAMVSPEFGRGKHGEYLRLLEMIGCNIVVLTAERHDFLCSYTSHMPQLLSTALAACVEEEVGDDRALAALSGRALREMTRVAHSPYGMWRDVALTNTKNLHDALLKMEQRLAHIRENLKTRELKEEFERGQALDLNGNRPVEDDFEPPKF